MWVGAAVAAGIIAVILFRTPSASSYQPAMYASAIPANAGVSVEQPWSATRGAADGISEHARAARVGVLLTDIELDAIRHDTSNAHLLSLAALLTSTSASGPVLSSIETLTSTRTAPSPEQVHAVGKQALALVDKPVADAGAYLEAARIATLSGDTTFIHALPPTALLPLIDDARFNAATKDALRALETGLSKRPVNSQQLGAELTRVLQLLAQ